MQTMLTCIGNKRKLVQYIFEIVRNTSDKPKLNIVDGFAVSSVVSRKLSEIADTLYTNDMEMYSYLMAKCYLETPSKKDQVKIQTHIGKMNDIAINGPFVEGIITRLYAPKDTNNVQPGERCFYTHENALIIDTLRKYISDEVPKKLQVYCLVPLLNKASIHTNTAGVFKGFYKKDDIGCFGGAGKNALARIMKTITLDVPIWSSGSFKSKCYNCDINKLIDELPSDIDVMYLDPPYNQHPYGSNYFMLNVIATNEEPEKISKVSGIPSNWQKSAYNSKVSAIKAMKELITKGLDKSRYLLISYNNEGIIPFDEWENLLRDLQVVKYEIKYDTYKGSRNLIERPGKVVEIMYLVSKN